MSPGANADRQLIKYPIESLRRDVVAFMRLSKEFIDNEHCWPLGALDAATELTEGQEFTWSIPEREPLCTRWSKAYEGMGRQEGAVSIRAEIWFTLRGTLRHDRKVSTQTRSKRAIPNIVEMNSGPTFEVRLRSDTNGQQAHMVFDVAGRQHPSGPLMHVDIKFDKVVRSHSVEHASADVHDVPVPRMLSSTLYLGDAVDYVLGELFPVEWQERLASGEAESLPGWKAHCDRLKRMFKCYSEIGCGWQGIKQDRQALWRRGVFENGVIT